MNTNTLIELAKHFKKKIFGNSYVLIAAKNNKTTKFSISFNEDEFTHFTGLEHIPYIANKLETQAINYKTGRPISKRKLRKQLYVSILKGNINYDDFSQKDKDSFVDTKLLANTYNPRTKKGCTIEDRIQELSSLSTHLNIGKDTELYKWDNTKPSIKLSSNCYRHCNIPADFVLKIPTKTPKYYMYLFLAEENKTVSTKKQDTIKLNVISAFCDGINLTQEQERPLVLLNYEILNKFKSPKHIFGDLENSAIGENSKYVSIQPPTITRLNVDNFGNASILLNPPKPIVVTLPIPPKLPFKEWFAKALNIIKGTFVSAKENLKSKKEAATTKEPSAKGEKQKNILTTNKATIHQQPQPEIVSIDDFDFIDTEEIATISENVAKAPLEPKQQEQASKENKRSGYSSFPTVNRPSDTKDTQSKERKKDNPSL